MKYFLFRTLFFATCILALSIVSTAQKSGAQAGSKMDSTATGALKGTGNVAVILVGSAAKATWWTTKFAASQVAKPIIVKVAPAAGRFALKKSAKYLLPLALKMSIL